MHEIVYKSGIVLMRLEKLKDLAKSLKSLSFSVTIERFIKVLH